MFKLNLTYLLFGIYNYNNIVVITGLLAYEFINNYAFKSFYTLLYMFMGGGGGG